MANIYSAIILDNDYWDGAESWAGETSEANRDAKYSTRRFTSMNAWRTDRDGNSSAADNEYGIIIGPWVTAESPGFNMTGFNADEAHIVCPVNLPDGVNLARHNGIPNDVTNAYVIDAITFGLQFTSSNTLFVVDGIQLDGSITGISTGTNTSVHITNCILDGDNVNSNAFAGQSGSDFIITNCVISGQWARGVYGYIAGTTYTVYNNTMTTTARASSRGIDCIAAANVYVKNCAVFNNALTPDIDADADTIDYCATDDGNGTNGVTLGGSTEWTANFNDYTNKDFTPLENGDLVGAGVGPSVDAIVPTTDIIGNPRSGATCTIGAFEYRAEWAHAFNGITGFSEINGISIFTKINEVT